MTSSTDYDRIASGIRRRPSDWTGSHLDYHELVRLATLAASSHNTQPWLFRIDNGSITILPDFSRRCPVVDPDDAHLFKSLGCAVENLVHAAGAQGHAVRVAYEDPANGIRIHLEPSRTSKGGELFHAIPTRQCTRTVYDGKPLTAETLKRLEEAGTGTGVRTVLLTARPQLETVTEFVTRGNRTQLNDPAFRKELVSWIRFNPGEAIRTGDGLSGRTSGQPALPRWLATLIIGAVLTPKGQSDADARNIRSSAAVAVLVTERDDSAAWVETGRAYERFALQATALGIRNAFINQPNEVRPIRSQFESWLGLQGGHALLIVRIGRAALAPYSLRRPIEDVIVQD